MKTVQEMVDSELAAVLAADAVTDAAALAAAKADFNKQLNDALAKDAAADAALLTTLNARITKLSADLAACQAGTPPVDPPPPPPVDPPPPPPTTGWPSASNTGVPTGTALTNSGAITTSANNQIIEGKNISGTLNINHNGVVVKKCKITASSFSVVRVKDGLSVPPIIEDCEVDAKAADGSNAINGYGTFRRLNIHNCENCFNIAGDGCLIEDCYLWGLKANNSDPHYDNIQIDGGTKNHIIRHNTIINDYGQTAAVMIDNWFGPISNVLVDNNLLKGGGYTVYSDGQFSGGSITGVKFTNNRIKKGYWGYATWEKNTPVWTGNTDFDDGHVIPISEA